MNKVSLIIKREYITRVRNKRFLLVTFLMPIIFIGFIAGSVYFAASGQEETTIAVVNDPGFLKENLNSDSGNVVFAFPEGKDSVNYKDKKYDGILYP
jgi:ABC-2 type transport system permease protein